MGLRTLVKEAVVYVVEKRGQNGHLVVLTGRANPSQFDLTLFKRKVAFSGCEIAQTFSLQNLIYLPSSVRQ